MPEKDFGTWLRSFRLARGLSGHEFAKALGISQAYVWKVEANKTPPSEKFLRAVAEKFNAPEVFSVARRLVPSDMIPHFTLRQVIAEQPHTVDAEKVIHVNVVKNVVKEVVKKEDKETDLDLKNRGLLAYSKIPVYFRFSYLLALESLLTDNPCMDKETARRKQVEFATIAITLAAHLEQLRQNNASPDYFRGFLASVLPSALPNATPETYAWFLSAIYACLLEAPGCLSEKRLRLLIEIIKTVLKEGAKEEHES